MPLRGFSLKLNGTHQLLAYADDVSILGGSVHTVKENAEVFVVATKEIELEVNADKTKYMVMSRDRNAGRGRSVKIDNSSIERVEEFKYLGTTLGDQNSIQEEIKSRLMLGNACYHLVQNLLSSRLQSKNLKIEIHSFINSLSYDRSKASSKASSPHSAIQSSLFHMRISSPFLNVIQ